MDEIAQAFKKEDETSDTDDNDNDNDNDDDTQMNVNENLDNNLSNLNDNLHSNLVMILGMVFIMSMCCALGVWNSKRKQKQTANTIDSELSPLL